MAKKSIEARIRKTQAKLKQAKADYEESTCPRRIKVARQKMHQLQRNLNKLKGLPNTPTKKQATKAKADAKRAARLEFYKSREWRDLRYRALKLHGRRCQCCGATPDRNGVVLHVDHIKPRSHYPSLELDLNNLQVLCEDCNLGKSNKDDEDFRPSNLFNLPTAGVK